MKTTAAVLVQTGQPLQICELETNPLKPGQVLVDVLFSGVCHTQILEARGRRGPDAFLPHCLGHEGSGRVREVGPGVTKVKPGQEVILSWIKGSGADVPGCTYDWEGRTVNSGAITTFGRQAVISENRLTPLPAGLDLRQAALLGCAAPTGLGVVTNTLRPQPGQSLAVLGAGGIGLCAVAGAAASGCAPVIAIDVNPLKLATASRLGATHVIDASQEDVAARVQEISPGGVDFAVESSGRPEVMAQALSLVRNQGGVAVVVGNAPAGQALTLDPKFFNLGRQLRGTWGGDNWPDRDYPRYARMLAAGRLDLAPLLDQVYSLAQINQALDDLEAGKVLRPMIDLGLE